MLKTATTLVHKGAMDIAVHSVSSFARHFSSTHRLEIHTDGTPNARDEEALLAAAQNIEAVVIPSTARREAVAESLKDFPLSAALIARGGYFTKFELPFTVARPFFYFDSDIVWLRPVAHLEPPHKPDVFSTESWSWYYGVKNEAAWFREKVPRRVNSGFYHLTTPFPHDRLERLIREDLYNPDHRFSTDQEMLAFIYPNIEHYHPDDLKRSRIGIQYDLASDPCAALHFPGRMWKEHMNQIKRLAETTSGRTPIEIRYQPAVPLDRIELMRMRATLAIANNPLLRAPVNLFRKIRQKIRS